MLYTILKSADFVLYFSAIGFIFTIIFGPLLFIELMMKKKQLQTIFLCEFKLSHKATEVTRNINNAFG